MVRNHERAHHENVIELVLRGSQFISGGSGWQTPRDWTIVGEKNESVVKDIFLVELIFSSKWVLTMGAHSLASNAQSMLLCGVPEENDDCGRFGGRRRGRICGLGGLRKCFVSARGARMGMHFIRETFKNGWICTTTTHYLCCSQRRERALEVL